MYAVLSFDTEDVYYPPEYGIDDIPGWLAAIMSEEGLRGTFFVFGEKARTLKERGRDDVIQAMLNHDLASHCQGNVRPLIPQVLEDAGWLDGVAAMHAYEDVVAADFRYAFGRDPVAFSQHNAYSTAQHIAAAGERGLPYMQGIARIDGCECPIWYAGTLTFTSPYFGGFDEIYTTDAAFDDHFRKLDQFITQHRDKGTEFVVVFGCHPIRVMGRGWLEHYTLANGLTRTPQDLGWVYSVKPRHEEEVAKRNFRRLCRYLKQHPDLEVVGISEAGRLFSGQPADINRDELTSYATRVIAAGRPLTSTTFSPAEFVCALAESLIHTVTHGDVPYAVPRRDVLGPQARPVVGMVVDIVTHAEIIDMCRQLVETVNAARCLPANVTTPRGPVGLGQLLSLCARAYLAEARYERCERLRVEQTPRYPDEAHRLDRGIRIAFGEHFGLPPEFSTERIAEQARLQAWTLKPAWLNPPRGSAMWEGRQPLG